MTPINRTLVFKEIIDILVSGMQRFRFEGWCQRQERLNKGPDTFGRQQTGEVLHIRCGLYLLRALSHAGLDGAASVTWWKYCASHHTKLLNLLARVYLSSANFTNGALAQHVSQNQHRKIFVIVIYIRDSMDLWLEAIISLSLGGLTNNFSSQLDLHFSSKCQHFYLASSCYLATVREAI